MVINENKNKILKKSPKWKRNLSNLFRALKTVICIYEAIMAEPSFSIKALLCWKRVHFLPFSASVDVGAAVCWPGAR